MRVHLVALGTYGDVLPLIAVAVELKRRGHAVGLAAPAPFGAFATRVGVPFHPLGSQADYDAFIAEPHLWRPWRGVRAVFRFAIAMTPATYRWIEAEARPGESVVVSSTLCLGARVAQDKLGLPLVTIHVVPLVMESRSAPPVLPSFPLPEFVAPKVRHWLTRAGDRVIIDRVTGPALNAFRAELGLPPARRLRHWWNLANRLVLMFPDWYAPPQSDWPAHALQVGFPVADQLGDATELSPEVEAFLDAGTPPLVFTYGSGMRKGGAFFETAKKLCARMGRRGIFLAPQDGQVPDPLPPEILRLRYAPLSRLLPRCAALVHHGGIGTVAQALGAGVPQLIVPVAFNHFDEVGRLERLGVGTALWRRRFTPRRAARVLGRLIADPAVAAACAEAKARMAGDDGVGQACDAIERTMYPART